MPYPRKHATPGKGRSVRVPDEIWDPAVRIARAREESATEVMVAALLAYVARYRHLDPGPDPERESVG